MLKLYCREVDRRAAMSKDTHLVNIYLKIHNKRSLTVDDLRYLAKYDPECFEKTCKNVIYNVPETKSIMQPVVKRTMEKNVSQKTSPHPNIEQILENIKRLEKKEFPVADLDADKVKNLLGNLYMELLFPHNDKETFINMPYNDKKSIFDKKA